MKHMLVSGLVVCLALTACGGQVTPDPAEVARLVDEAVEATVAAVRTPIAGASHAPLHPHLGATQLSKDIESLINQETHIEEPIVVGLMAPEEVISVDRKHLSEHEPLVLFLVDNGYLQIRETSDGLRWYLGAFCTEALKPYIVSGSCEVKGYRTGRYGLLLAKRKLKGIGFTNQWPVELEAGELFALNFTYTLEEVLPGLPDIKEEFAGQVEQYWDPSDGVWHNYGGTLSDSGQYEYILLLKDLLSETSMTVPTQESSATPMPTSQGETRAIPQARADIIGMFVRENDPNEYLELKQDGTCSAGAPTGHVYPGTWTVDEDTIALTFTTGESLRLQITENSSLVCQGIVYVKK